MRSLVNIIMCEYAGFDYATISLALTTDYNGKYYNISTGNYVRPTKSYSHINNEFKIVANRDDTFFFEDVIKYLEDNREYIDFNLINLQLSLAKDNNYYNVTTGKWITPSLVKKMTFVNDEFKVVANKDDVETYHLVLDWLTENDKCDFKALRASLAKNTGDYFNISYNKWVSSEVAKHLPLISEEHKVVAVYADGSFFTHFIDYIKENPITKKKAKPSSVKNKSTEASVNLNYNDQDNSNNVIDNILEAMNTPVEDCYYNITSEKWILPMVVQKMTNVCHKNKIVANKDDGNKFKLICNFLKGVELPKTEREVSLKVRNSVWRTYAKKLDASCWCCDSHIAFEKWYIGYILPLNKCGTNTVNNIRPICRKCKLSIASKPMKLFIEENELFGQGREEFGI